MVMYLNARNNNSCTYKHGFFIYCISAVFTQHTKSDALLQLVTFGHMFRPLPGHHQANME